MKHKTKKMVKIYELTDKCFMGFPVNSNSKFTFHHCVKKEYGGNNSIDNGAVLTLEAHRFLNYLELNNYEIYYQINCKLIEISKGKQHPSINQLKEIKNLIMQYYRLKSLEEIEENKIIPKKVLTIM